MATGRKTGGRKRGTPNKLTTAFKDAVRTAYNGIGGHSAFAKWAKENPTEFYRIAARLIPTEIHTSTDMSINVVINRGLAVVEGECERLESVPLLK